MLYSTLRLRRYRKVFGWMFLASVAVLFVSNVFLFTGPAPQLPGPPDVTARPPPNPASASGAHGPSGRPNLPSPPSGNLSLYISAASLLTSTASLAGFFFTSIVTWRKERREQRHSELDLEKKKLELEKLRRELAGKHEQADGPK